VLKNSKRYASRVLRKTSLLFFAFAMYR